MKKIKVKKDQFLAVAAYVFDDVQKLLSNAVEGVKPCDKIGASCLLCKNFVDCAMGVYEKTAKCEEEFDAYE